MLSHLRQFKIIPLLKMKNLDVNDALNVAEALCDAGLPALEIVFRRFSDSKAIREIACRFPDFHIGAGNILNRDQFLRAFDAQARFAISPGTCVETMKEACKRNITYLPGVSTCTDVLTILNNGIVDFHYFPAETSGGVEHLLSIIEPFDHLPIEIFARGGIDELKIKKYLRVPFVAAVSVEWIASCELIESKNWGKIKDEARRAIDLAQSL
ncbi:MAG: bifunctional 4-hydroxy-2-oxoglutarate aldolase/2-dehydro-3-deoxy-phosphogluconate aldolase [Victivallales bacterium]|nr:bifunctional 4-hydroxy-2-oxoglutarate aldolase/2-dehydro-3-deoxy-phosphogluconate aldolase [Victivallales bacterium]